jgi:hypothetical protein
MATRSGTRGAKKSAAVPKTKQKKTKSGTMVKVSGEEESKERKV